MSWSNGDERDYEDQQTEEGVGLWLEKGELTLGVLEDGSIYVRKNWGDSAILASAPGVLDVLHELGRLDR